MTTDVRGFGVNSIGTCSACGYRGPGPDHACKRTCPLCNTPCRVAICNSCRDDLEYLGKPQAEQPAPEATRDEVIAWCKANDVTVFICNTKEMP